MAGTDRGLVAALPRKGNGCAYDDGRWCELSERILALEHAFAHLARCKDTHEAVKRIEAVVVGR